MSVNNKVEGDNNLSVVEAIENTDQVDETVLNVKKKTAVKMEVVDPATSQAGKQKKEKEKKKPGRPKKIIVNIPVEINGIVDKPSNDENLVELVYQNPKIFKKIFAQYKSYDSTIIDISFNKTDVKIITRDHKRVIVEYTILNCNLLNHYYCKNPIRVGVKRDNLERLFRNIDKTHYKITFMLKEDYRSTLYMNIKNYEMGNEIQYEIEVVQNLELDELDDTNYDETNYPVKFEFPSKHFKTLIGDLKILSNTFSIQKLGLEPLQFTYEQTSKVNMNDVYYDSNKIKLHSIIKENEIFTASVDITRVSPFSKSNMGDVVYIAADWKQPLCLYTELDKIKVENAGGTKEGYVCMVKIFIQIKS